jgi:hypothetical protein
MTDPQPPWEAFPDKKPVSLFWRMGTGEGFFHHWLEVIGAYDRPQLDRYLDERAAPPEWRKVVEMNLEALQEEQQARDEEPEDG